MSYYSAYDFALVSFEIYSENLEQDKLIKKVTLPVNLAYKGSARDVFEIVEELNILAKNFTGDETAYAYVTNFSVIPFKERYENS